MTSTSSGYYSWRVATLGIVAGVGAGYLVGLISARWWHWRRRYGGASRPTQGPPLSHADLAAALADLTSQVESLQAAIAELLLSTRRQRPRSAAVESVASGFLSAREDSAESEDEFFDLDSGRQEEEEVGEGLHRSMAYLDELGKSTLESEDTCHTLVKELSGLLAGASDSVQLLWRLSRVLVHLSIHCQQQGRVEEEKRLLVEAAGHAQKALELDGSAWQGHQWYAIALGSQIKYEGTQRKITAGNEYKEHIDAAISLNSNEPNLFYLRGRWSYEVASLSWLERKAATALYATPPNSTFDEALEDFVRVESLGRERAWKANLLCIAKCHFKLGDSATAMDWLRKSLLLEAVTSEDKTAHKEATQLMATHDPYQ